MCTLELFEAKLEQLVRILVELEVELEQLVFRLELLQVESAQLMG